VPIDPRTPVVVGAAATQRRDGDPVTAPDAIELMVAALHDAGADAGAPGLLPRVDVVLVPKGSWSWSNPGRHVAVAIGAEARGVRAEIGVLQHTLLANAAAAVARGAANVVAVCGGETRFRAAQAARAGAVLVDRDDASGPPDEVLAPVGEIITRLEVERGLGVPARQYAIMETALRAARRQSVAEHAGALAEMWSRLSSVAATNPDAWTRAPMSAAALAGPSEANPYLATPYTKRHCAQWTVDQAGAVILCAAEVADRLGVARDRWVFPLAAAESNAMIPLSNRADMSRCPAVAEAGRWVGHAAGVHLADVEEIELYSCFPSAVEIQAAELGLGPDRALTVTGGMAFAGGPLNNATLTAMATVVRRLRADPEKRALVTSVSGMLTKQGVSLWSASAPRRPFRAGDVSDAAVAATAVVPVDAEHRGPVRVEGYCVVHEHGAPVGGIVLARSPTGQRAVVGTDDSDVAASMVTEEWCGRTVKAAAERFEP
jgi:acetyl-CoA C-acetyltransferase